MLTEQTANHTYDLAIVGGGIIGLWVARLACQHWPDARILLLEQTLIGNGASHYSLGMNYFYGDTPNKKQQVLQSKKLWEELFTSHPELAAFRTHHPFYFFASPEHAAEMCLRFVGSSPVPLSAIKMQEFLQQYPWFLPISQQETPKLQGFLHENAFRVYPEIVSTMALLLQKKYPKFHVFEGIKLTDFACKKNSIHLLTASEHVFKAKKTILALGPWITGLLKIPKLRNKKIVSLHFSKPSRPNDPIIYLPEEPAFLLPDSKANRWILSIKSETWDSIPDTNQLTITENDREKGFSIIEKYCPQFKDCFQGGRVFCDVYSEGDAEPYVLSQDPAVVVASAGSGVGLRLAPAIAWEALNKLNT